MSKFLLIGSVAAMLYGDCVWGMGDDIDPWRGTSSSESDQFNAEPARSNANPKVRSRRNSTAFSHDAQTQTEQFRAEHVQANPQQLQENRFIKIKSEYGQIYGGPSGAVLNNTYLQYHYDLSNNSKIGRATPTTVTSVTDDLKCWNDISEIRYANDVSYDKLENPKVVLYRNFDKSCYIILRTDDGKKYGVFYGLNERNVEIGRQSFAVYEVSEDVGSFTDGVKRLIYVDESGLYFVPANENPMEDVIKTYQNEGKFDFEGSVIKVSAIDGTITWNGNAITEDNFFDNWVIEGGFIIKGSSDSQVSKTVLSTKQPKLEEIIRNFYPPNGTYGNIYSRNNGTGRLLNTFTEIPVKNEYGTQTNLSSSKWMDYFVLIHILTEKSKSKKGCEEVVRNGMFSSFLSNFMIHPNDFLSHRSVSSGFLEAVNRQIKVKGIPRAVTSATHIVFFQDLLRDPEFVRGLKKGFAGIEASWKPVKESEMWILFEIVRNL